VLQELGLAPASPGTLAPLLTSGAEGRWTDRQLAAFWVVYSEEVKAASGRTGGLFFIPRPNACAMLSLSVSLLQLLSVSHNGVCMPACVLTPTPALCFGNIAALGMLCREIGRGDESPAASLAGRCIWWLGSSARDHGGGPVAGRCYFPRAGHSLPRAVVNNCVRDGTVGK
jgi:hypothetical protein